VAGPELVGDAQGDVAAAAASLVGAFGRHDPEAYFAHFSPDATFVFYNVASILRSRRQYEELWRTWEEENGFRVLRCLSRTGEVRMLGPQAAVFTHEVTTTVATAGREETLAERETIVFARSGDRWVAVHEHLSG